MAETAEEERARKARAAVGKQSQFSAAARVGEMLHRIFGKPTPKPKKKPSDQGRFNPDGTRRPD